MRVGDALLGLWLIGAGSAGIACRSPQGATHRDPGECATCHLPEYVATRSPMHVGHKPTMCHVCHGTTDWHPSRLEHPFWALTGAHETTECFGCHAGTPPVFRGTSKGCIGCHRADFDRATFPADHPTFPLRCEECHTTTAWKPSTWTKQPEPAPTATASVEPRTPSPKPAPQPRSKPRPAPTKAPPSAGPPDVVTRPSPR